MAPRLEEAEVGVCTEHGIETRREMRLTNGGHHLYSDIGLALPYSGTALIGDEREALAFRNFGFPMAYMYRKVLELTFENGTLVDVADVSESFAQKREEAVERELHRWD